jgi:hypothetical protein
MRTLLVAIVLLQIGQRPPLTPAETLLEPGLLRTIERASVEGPALRVISGTDTSAGEVVLACSSACEAVEWAMSKLATAAVPKPSRTIRMITVQGPSASTKAAIFVADSTGTGFQVLRSLWSAPGIADEVVEVFARHAVKAVDAKAYEPVGQPMWERQGIPITTIVPPNDASGLDRASFVAAATAYFLATMPNPGAEALLSHLTIGAHARLAEDGRRAVAMMGNQQRAGGDVLVLMGQAIEREQRRMRNVERFMPEPVDPMLRSRIAEMEQSITSVWTSLGITSSPYMPPADRLRGRSGEDRRVPSRATSSAAPADLPTALAKHPNAFGVAYELTNFTDGKRSISDIRDAVAAEFGSVPLPAVVDFFERLAKSGAVSLR